MKRLFLVFALGFFSISLSFAGGNPEIQLNPYSEYFVLVSFRIVSGEIKIEDISGSQVE
ncbi:MAG: hypothetical protein HRT57_13210 [Crocinitomicaceae bacterium]|nr:hypothetical protein [Crocinitomicaceae bacterium]